MGQDTITPPSPVTPLPILARARPEILAMSPYVSARSLVRKTPDMVFLDANECPYEPLAGVRGYARYGDQQPSGMVEAMCRLYDVSSRNILVTRGADEAIDLLVRTFCTAGQDHIIICPPTFPMYAQAAALQGVEARAVSLTSDFALDVAGICAAADAYTKIVFVCSPNNPTGNLMSSADIEALCVAFADKALVVVDETYIAYAQGVSSLIRCIEAHDNLVVLRTLSKELACAGVRCGAALARADVVDLLRKVLPPYPVPVPVAQAVCEILKPDSVARLAARRLDTLETREFFSKELNAMPDVLHVYSSDSNFLLVRFRDCKSVCRKALESGFVLRDQSHQEGLENCVRISIGSAIEMQGLLAVLRGESVPCVRSHAPLRRAEIVRRTSETAIDVCVDLDRAMPVEIETGVGFYDHMLDQVARHGGFSLVLHCKGDLGIDAHHTVEDCAIALGTALARALGDKCGIGRFGFTAPLDESLAQVSLDLSGRAYLAFKAEFPDSSVGDLPVDMVEHIFRSLAESLKATIHVSVTGQNTHHMVESAFKAFGRALRQAIHRQETDILPSTKGVL